MFKLKYCFFKLIYNLSHCPRFNCLAFKFTAALMWAMDKRFEVMVGIEKLEVDS